MLKKSLSLMLVLCQVLVGFFLMGCTSSNVFTYIIDEEYEEFITMGTSADYPPYEWPTNVDGTQTLVGIDIEIAKEIAKALGMNLKIVNKGFDYLLDDLTSGKVDFVIAGMTPTDDRAEKVDFSVVYYEAIQVVLVSEDNASVYTTIESLNSSSIRVGAQMGAIQQDLAEEFFIDSQKVYLQTIPDLIMKLSEGLIEALIVEEPVATGYLANVEGLSIASFSIGDPDGGSAVAVQKGNQTLLVTINEVLNGLMTSGKLEEIVSEMILLNGTVE
ncbi:MAG: transporter substrate-binding domain-containing protein [Firmicutes bacterium]|nr:transporter substrate-binding domain-containing protein [Bacillota bacterium]